MAGISFAFPGSPRLDRGVARHYGARRFGRGAGAYRAMSEGEPSDPLSRLGEKLDRARSRARAGGSGPAAEGGALGFGLRIGIELIAALIVGVVLGLTTDYFLGTRPWGLIAFFFIGSAAGVVNVFRAAQGLGRGGRPPGGKG
jgi:ATP synthase protein I